MTRPSSAYRAQVASGPVETNGVRLPDTYRVWSTPHPIHHGLVTRPSELWVFTLTSVPTGHNTRIRYSSLEGALVAAGQIIGLKAGQDMAAKFDRVQRMAMAGGECPKRLGATICGEPAIVGTIWCMWHPHGRPNGHV